VNTPPLPPLSIFEGGSGLDTAALPNFEQYTMPDALSLAHRLREAKAEADDERDAIAALIAAGLLQQ